MKNKVLIKQSLFLLTLFSGVILALIGIMQLKLNFSNRDLVYYIVEDSNPFIKTDLKMMEKITSFISGFDLQNPISILENHFEERKDNLNDLKKITSYVNDSNYSKVNNPLIYLYNTYQLEDYQDSNKIKPNVLMASYYLRDQLQRLDISTLVETTDITNIINKNNSSYDQSPIIIRSLVKDNITKHTNLKLIIDIERDLAPYKATTLTLNEEVFAKILFIVNDQNPNSVTLANNLSNKLNGVKANLSRGVVIKKNLPNFDLSEKIILIKCGGRENNFPEVKKTLDILAQVIKAYLGENYGES